MGVIYLGDLCVTSDINYCARPVMVAEAYVAIATATPAVKDISLKASGSSKTSKCENV